MEIFKLIGRVMVDTASAENSLQKTDSKASKVGQTLSKGAKTVGTWGAAIGTAAVAAAGAMVKVANDTSDATDNIDKMSQKLGMSYEAYQKWDYVLGQAGVDIDSMQTGLKTLTNQIGQAANGSGDAAARFEQLGVTVDDLKTMSREDIFGKVIQGFQNMEDSTERAALANKLFGKSGQELTPLFNESAEATAQLMQKADDLGIVLSDDTVKAGVSFHDTLDSMQRTVQTLAAHLGGALMPIIEKVMNAIIDHMPQIESYISQLEPIATSFLDEMLPLLLQLGETLLPIIFDVLQQLLPAVTSIVSMILPPIVQLLSDVAPILSDLISTVLPVALDIITALWPLLESILTLISPLLELLNVLLKPLLMLIDLILPPICDLISYLVGQMNGNLSKAIQWIADLLGKNMAQAMQGFELFKKVIGTLWEKIQDVFAKVKDKVFNVGVKIFQTLFDKFNKLKSVFTTVAQALGQVFKKPINFIINGINTFLQGINKIKIPDWVPLVGGQGFSIPMIPELAKGGVLEKGQTGFLEGNGAEAVVPLDQNDKWTAAVAEKMTALAGGQTTELLGAILEALQDIADAGIYLDGKTLVGGISNEIDKQLGRVYTRKVRA